MKISFVIPVYNEAESLQQLHRELKENVLGYEHEFIFVDDGSTDGGYKVLQSLAEIDSSVKIIKFRSNFGKSAALQNGFYKATGDYIFTIDSDLQDAPEEIPLFIKKIEEGYDLVSGWKQKRKDPLIRKISSYFYNLTTSLLFKLRLHDFNCGFKLYKADVVKELDIYGELHRYIPVLAASKGFKVTEIPVKHRARKHGKTKFGKERYLRGFFDLLTVRLITHYIRSPLYLFGGVGFICSFSGALIGLYLTILKFFFGVHLTNRPLLFMSILLIMVGLQFFSIGLIGELLVNQTRKFNSKDYLSIEKEINFD